VATVVMVSGSTPREEAPNACSTGDVAPWAQSVERSIEKQVTQEALAVIKSGQAKKLEYKLNRR